MADNKKMVEAITSRDEDFAKWYTDIVKKAELVDYSGVKGCMVIRPYGYAIWENIQADLAYLCGRRMDRYGFHHTLFRFHQQGRYIRQTYSRPQLRLL